MSTYYGDDAIAYLAEKPQQIDIKSSSHWNKYHADFSFKNGEFSGIEGFGSNENKYTGLRKIAHLLLQIPFNNMGKKFSDFNAVDNIAKNVLHKQNKGYSVKFHH